MCVFKHLWGVIMKVLLDHMAETSRPGRKFGHLLEICTKSHVQLGALTSEIFSERMVICANLLVDTYRLKFGDDMIDKLITLRMNKKFMDRMRCKTTFVTMALDEMDANKRMKV